jgi:hypothetical protein
MTNSPPDMAFTASLKYDAASSRTAKPRGQDVTIVSVRAWPPAIAGAASEDTAAALPPRAEAFRKERRSIYFPPMKLSSGIEHASD